MTASVSTARRVTIVTPRARMDVALPAQSTLAELVPQLIELAGATEDAGADLTGWQLTRLGGAALPPGLTVTAAGLRHGEVLYLSPGERHTVPLLFDDVIDSIASVARDRRGAWRPVMARRVAVAAGSFVFLAAVLLAQAALAGTPLAAVASGIFAVALLASGGALARAYGDPVSGTATAGVGLFAALLGGITALPPHTIDTGADALAVGLAAVAVYCSAAAVLLADRQTLFGAVGLAAGLGAIGAAIISLSDASAHGVAAVLAVLSTALLAGAPMISLRLGKLPLPRVPSDMDTFRAGEQPTLGPDMLDETVIASRILTGLLAALGSVVFGSVIVLLREPDGWQATLAGTLSLAWLLRSRSYAATGHRIVLVTVGLFVAAWLAVWLAFFAPAWLVFSATAVAAVAGVLCLNFARRVTAGRQSPHWGRVLDIAEFLSLISLVPLAGVVLGVYEAVRNAVG